MTMYDSIGFLAPFLEAFTYFLLFEAFLEREKKEAVGIILQGSLFCLALLVFVISFSFIVLLILC